MVTATNRSLIDTLSGPLGIKFDSDPDNASDEENDQTTSERRRIRRRAVLGPQPSARPRPGTLTTDALEHMQVEIESGQIDTDRRSGCSNSSPLRRRCTATCGSAPRNHEPAWEAENQAKALR